MVESRIVITDRLRAEGRWDEACHFRDDERRRLRAEGRSRTDATEESWVRMADKFPPLAATLSAADGIADVDELNDEALAARSNPGQIDFMRDVIWVYSNIANPRAKATDAPCLGAWSMLRWARGNPQRFFERMLPTAMARHSGPNPNDEADEEDGFQSLKECLKSFAH